MGIPGNEKADKAAKEALNQPLSEKFTRPLAGDLAKLSTSQIKNKWEEEWKQLAPQHVLETDNKFFDQRPPMKLSRRELAVITRLRIGHSKLTHSYLLTETPPPPL